MYVAYWKSKDNFSNRKFENKTTNPTPFYLFQAAYVTSGYKCVALELIIKGKRVFEY